MDDAIRQLMHQLMTDRQHRTIAQQAMMYGHATKKMDFKQFAAYTTSSNLQKATPQELYTLLTLFYETTKKSQYDPAHYFDAKEIARYSNSKCYQLFDFPVWSTLSKDEYLSEIPLVRVLQILAEMLAAQRTDQYQRHRLVYTTGGNSKETAEEIRQRFHLDTYYPPLFWINVVPDECELLLKNNSVSIPLQPPACRVIVDADFMRAVKDVDDINALINSISEKKMAPLRITGFSMERLKKVNVDPVV